MPKMFIFQVNPKRTNRPGLSTTDRGLGRGRSRGRGMRGGYFNPYANYGPRPRGRAMFRLASAYFIWELLVFCLHRSKMQLGIPKFKCQHSCVRVRVRVVLSDQTMPCKCKIACVLEFKWRMGTDFFRFSFNRKLESMTRIGKFTNFMWSFWQWGSFLDITQFERCVN